MEDEDGIYGMVPLTLQSLFVLYFVDFHIHQQLYPVTLFPSIGLSVQNLVLLINEWGDFPLFEEIRIFPAKQRRKLVS